ncbi:hypothetical protein HY333_01570 [Candidatus Collierbacteria bacterium]|nr:hypothetical protein [Candidatus Collierbacteria bacterium]
MTKKLLSALSLVPTALAAPTLGVPKPEQVRITDIGKLIASGVSLIIIVAGILTFAFLVWGGIQWILSGGDKTKTEEARNRITAALVGLAIVAASWALIKIISFFFGVPDIFEGGLPIPRPY